MEGRAAEMNEFVFQIQVQSDNFISKSKSNKPAVPKQIKILFKSKILSFLFCQWQNYNPSTVFASWVKIDTHTAYQIYIFKTIGSATEVRARESVIVDLSNDSHSSQATSTLSNTPNLNIGFLRRETLQNQARNQLGTPGGAKSFLIGAQIFEPWPIILYYSMPNTFFQWGWKILQWGFFPQAPLVTDWFKFKYIISLCSVLLFESGSIWSIFLQVQWMQNYAAWWSGHSMLNLKLKLHVTICHETFLFVLFLRV